MAVVTSDTPIADMQQTYPRRSAVISWIFFDWAAQPYFMLITTFVFAPYFATHVASDPASGQALFGFLPLFGLDPVTHQGDRITGPLTGIWFIVFVLPMFLLTPDYPAKRRVSEALREGLADLRQTLSELPKRKSLAAFLLANMIYTDGLVSLFAFGGIYAAGTFNWSTIQIGSFGIILAIAGTFGAWLGGKLDDRLGPKRVITGSMLILLSSIVAILLVDKDSIFFVKVAPPGPDGALFSGAAERAYLLLGCLIGVRRRPAAGGVADASDTVGAARPRRAIFRAVRADWKGHLLRRAAADRRDHRNHRKPEGGHGGAGGVLRGGTGAAGAGGGEVIFTPPRSAQLSPRRPCESMDP